MRVKKTILLFGFLCLINLTYSQNNGRITYGVSLEEPENNKSTKDKKKSKSVNRAVNSMIETAKQFDLVLTFSKGKSYYELIEPMNMDNREEALFKMAKVMFKAKNKFFTSIIKRKVTEEKDFLGEKFLIERDLNISDWKLTNNKEKIGNYICYRAERSYTYDSRKGKSSVKQIVWYSPEIPLSFGPAEFSGFPGLVLKARTGNIIYYAKKIELNLNAKIKVLKPTEGKKVTDEELRKIAKKARENFANN